MVEQITLIGLVSKEMLQMISSNLLPAVAMVYFSERAMILGVIGMHY